MRNTTDRKKKRRGALLSALVVGGFMLVLAVCMVLAGLYDVTSGAETVILLACSALYFAIVGGIALALRQRWKEIEGGEEDEARKY